MVLFNRDMLLCTRQESLQEFIQKKESSTNGMCKLPSLSNVGFGAV